MKQEIIAGIILFAIGLSLLIIPPEKWWTATEKWKTKDGGQPSKSYAAVLRLLGIVFTSKGGILVIYGLL